MVFCNNYIINVVLSKTKSITNSFNCFIILLDTIIFRSRSLVLFLQRINIRQLNYSPNFSLKFILGYLASSFSIFQLV
jgi:hypothetical protein